MTTTDDERVSFRDVGFLAIKERKRKIKRTCTVALYSHCESSPRARLIIRGRARRPCHFCTSRRGRRVERRKGLWGANGIAVLAPLDVIFALLLPIPFSAWRVTMAEKCKVRHTCLKSRDRWNIRNIPADDSWRDCQRGDGQLTTTRRMTRPGEILSNKQWEHSRWLSTRSAWSLMLPRVRFIEAIHFTRTRDYAWLLARCISLGMRLNLRVSLLRILLCVFLHFT